MMESYKYVIFYLQIQNFIGNIIKDCDTTLYLLHDILSLLSHIPRLSPENTSLVSTVIKDEKGCDIL